MSRPAGHDRRYPPRRRRRSPARSRARRRSRAAALSELAGCEVWLKLETLHPTGSFKERGALNKLLTPRRRPSARAGVVAMSAGNHAQGVAYHARRLGIPATIVMPEGTPVHQDRPHRGARRHGRAEGRQPRRRAPAPPTRSRASAGCVPVHPYDDPAVIAGQGTIALEMLADRPDLDTLIVPIGGGGLISGHRGRGQGAEARDRDRRRAVGALPVDVPACCAASDPGPPADGATLAEGIAVKEPGQLTRRIVAALVGDILLVDERELEGAVELLIERAKAGRRGRRRGRRRGAAGRARAVSRPASRHRRLPAAISTRACSPRS